MQIHSLLIQCAKIFEETLYVCGSGQVAELDASEVAWFAPLCSDDYDLLGVPNPNLRSSWENTSAIVKRADELGFRNVLCPSSYQVGQDTLTFASGMAPLTQNINLLAAIRCGELHPAMLALHRGDARPHDEGSLDLKRNQFKFSSARTPPANTAISVAMKWSKF